MKRRLAKLWAEINREGTPPAFCTEVRNMRRIAMQFAKMKGIDLKGYKLNIKKAKRDVMRDRQNARPPAVPQ